MIIGKKVTIRPVEESDIDFLYNWWNNGDMMAHAGLAYGVLSSKTAISEKIMEQIKDSNTYSTSKRFIICKKEDKVPIGEMGYSNWNKRSQNAEFGIKICETSEQGKGYGEDTLFHFIDFMFKHLNLEKIYLSTIPDNKRAHSLYHKLGFKNVGVMRKDFFDSRTGTLSDVLYMDLLKDEWLEVKENYHFK
ncbi:GNAT family N-acetyltransferase [Dethiothermospora halolimnae]|uniref:GNAT family N-acetyltransferase n=1 Tax=Dethiothermospora halolimnae TaxID=3114390 RepID=UPI003CCB8952